MRDVQTIIDCLRALFIDRFHVDVPSADTDLLESGILDSLQFVDLLVSLEQEFGFRLSIEAIELDDLRTLSRLATLLASRPDAVPLPARPVDAAVAANSAVFPSAGTTDGTHARQARGTGTLTLVDMLQDTVAPESRRPMTGAG